VGSGPGVYSARTKVTESRSEGVREGRESRAVDREVDKVGRQLAKFVGGQP
jgi:hypothetical protein